MRAVCIITPSKSISCFDENKINELLTKVNRQVELVFSSLRFGHPSYKAYKEAIPFVNEVLEGNEVTQCEMTIYNDMMSNKIINSLIYFIINGEHGNF